MIAEERARAELVEVGRRIYERGFVAANSGNISVRLADNSILTTPTGVSKGYMAPEMMVKVDLAGARLAGNLKPSSELKMHLGVYQCRPDVNAVLHAHPPAATAFAVSGIPLDKPVLPEVIIFLGTIPTAEYGTPSTDQLFARIRKYLAGHDGMLLENHGALTMGSDLTSALFKMESIEHFATVSLYARLLGQERELPAREVEKLLRLRDNSGISGPKPRL